MATAPELEALTALFSASLQAGQHKQAEAALKLEEEKPKFSLNLLQIIAAGDAIPQQLRLAAALYFKNFIKHHYVDEERNYKIDINEVSVIKTELIGLMINSPSSIQAQLGEAISIIADSDFWDRWDTLVADLVSRLTPDNSKVNNGVLEVAHSIFKRWRPLFRSDDLFAEINHVLSQFSKPFLQLLQSTDAQIEANASNAEALKGYMKTMHLSIMLFNDLSCQDLPPDFEENLSSIAGLLQKYLTYDNSLLHTDDDSESGIQEDVKTEICDVLILYTQKYEDAFGTLLPPFITTLWNLLTTVGPETKYDLVASKSLQFLKTVCGNKAHAENFNNEGVLGQVVEKAILPSVSLRESDVELFEDEPIEFIRKNLEGTDVDTRRRAATEFIRKLLEHFEPLVTQVVGKYVQFYLEKYEKNPSEEWMAKDAAVYLFSAIAAKGSVTASQGIKTTNDLVNVVDFFQNNVAGDLVGADTQPMLKVGAINYLYTFRSQLSKEQWQAAFQPLVQNMASDNYVVYTYAAIAVERALALTNDQKVHIFEKEDIQPFAKDLLTHLFTLVEKDAAPEKVQENEFLMRCVMRVLIVIKDGVVPINDLVLDHLVNITKVITANPSNPRFYYYHFEALGALIRYAAPAAPEKMEQALYMPFAEVLGSEAEEFKPYIFQLFSALLESRPQESLSEYYKQLIGPVLTGELWNIKGNVPALSRLLCSLIQRGSEIIAAQNQLEAILGLFQLLITRKSKQESYAFDILEAVLVSFGGAKLQQYFAPILQLIFSRLDSPTVSEAFKLRFVRFYHLVSALNDPQHGFGTDYFIAATDSIQEGAFVPIYLKIIIPTTQAIAKPLDRKVAALSLTKTLCDSQKFAERYVKGWTITAEALVKLLNAAPMPVAQTDFIAENDVDDMAFGVGFTALNTCKRQPRDVFPEIADVKPWVSQYYRSGGLAGKGADAQTLLGWLEQRISPEVRSRLNI